MMTKIVIGVLVAAFLLLFIYWRRRRKLMRELLSDAETNDSHFGQLLFPTTFMASQEVCGYFIEMQHEFEERAKSILVKRNGILLFRGRTRLSMEGPRFEVLHPGVNATPDMRREMRHCLVEHYREVNGFA